MKKERRKKKKKKREKKEKQFIYTPKKKKKKKKKKKPLSFSPPIAPSCCGAVCACGFLPSYRGSILVFSYF